MKTRTDRRSKEWLAWSSAKSRCHNKSHASFKNYGQRGIVMCESWRASSSEFIKHMGQCPDGWTLDRIDTNKGYEPGNCRWADYKTQQNNRRNNHKITWLSETKTLTEWADYLGINKFTLSTRLLRGWEIKRAFVP